MKHISECLGKYHAPFSNKLVCPICKDDHIHFVGFPVKEDSDSYQAWEGRGDVVKVPLFCENGHYFSLKLGFHKGNIFISYEQVGEINNYSFSYE